jgi:hypothetical protein
LCTGRYVGSIRLHSSSKKQNRGTCNTVLNLHGFHARHGDARAGRGARGFTSNSIRGYAFDARGHSSDARERRYFNGAREPSTMARKIQNR